MFIVLDATDNDIVEVGFIYLEIREQLFDDLDVIDVDEAVV